jgi:hypothetical protein
MLLPSVEQYTAAVLKKDPEDFSYLNDYTFLSANGNERASIVYAGNSAAIFRASKDSKNYAIRFFLNAEPEIFFRWQQVAAYLQSENAAWKVGFDYIDREIFIDGQWYPGVIMEWVDGIKLDDYILQISNDEGRITALQQQLVELQNQMEGKGVAHGNLNFHHILVDRKGKNDQLRLLDYTSMFIPSFEGKLNEEPGTPGFQHPKRLSSDFSPDMDRFAVWMFLTCLEALKAEPGLWKGARKETHFLFTVMDLIYPDKSRAFQKLRSFGRPSLNFYLDKLSAACKVKDLRAIEKPELYRPVGASRPVQPMKHTAEEEKQYTIEIKTIPAGKDVLVQGVKKGITPLRLSLFKKDFHHVAVSNGSAVSPVPVNEQVDSYEIDFLQKQRPPGASQMKPDSDEIIEFRPDMHTVTAGELVTLYWKVRGNSRIYISNIGEVQERTGTRQVVMNKTTDYFLTTGTAHRSITINVEDSAKTATTNDDPGERHPLGFFRKFGKSIILTLCVLLVASGAYFAVMYISSDETAAAEPEAKEQTSVAEPERPVFTTSNVSTFLEQLFSAYNQRDLNAIMVHYAGTVENYYDTKKVRNDSLRLIIKDLFIAPAFYEGKPVYTTLTIKPTAQSCSVVIQIREKLKSRPHGKTERYTTTIEYILDPSFRIISEKNPE